MSKHWYILLTMSALGYWGASSIQLTYPDYFPTPVYDFDTNELTEAKIQLGRALFYDPVLSKDGTISCASCHSPYNAFAHTDHDLSHGIDDQIGLRNAPALFNLAWQTSFNWDGAIHHLDMQALAPINDLREMGETTANVVQKLQDKNIYPPLFKKAFEDSVVSGANMLKALAAFQLILVSSNSPYDQMRNGEYTFTPQEQNGYILFQKNCNHCHQEPLFTSYEFASNDLPIDTTLNDYGKGSITQRSSDSLLFKIPSLRNLSYTYPYMHDGRFKKIRQVIKHYTNGIQASPTLANALQQGINMNSMEQTDLIAFLLTLNDRDFVFDEKHQFPKSKY